VTNNHVIDHAKSVQVTTDDGRTYLAKVIGSDPNTVSGSKRLGNVWE
jgi:serine protease Do